VAPHKGKRIDTPGGMRVIAKAANGDGSVYRQADGRWVATWWVAGRKRPGERRARPVRKRSTGERSGRPPKGSTSAR
jgi:hypothetical protein